MEQALLKEKKYNGRYVAIKDFNDATVIGSGSNPREAYEQALKEGVLEPVILFVPHKDMAQIY